MTYQDAAGNTYRNQGGEWQVLKQGIGWSAFSADVNIELNDGTIIPASAKEPSAPKYSEAEKSILISHARDIHLHVCAQAYASGGDNYNRLALDAVDDAKALVEALRNEGVL